MLLVIKITILILTLGASCLIGRFFVNGLRITNKILIYKYVFFITVFIIFTLLFYQSYLQFEVWSHNELSKFLLPPYQTLDYFIYYSFFKFFAPYFMSLLASLIFLFTAKFLNKKYQERFFEQEELYFGALAIFLVGHPGWLFYAVILITFYFLLSTFYFLLLKRQKRLSLYYWWIPVGIFVILIERWLQVVPFWQLLKI